MIHTIRHINLYTVKLLQIENHAVGVLWAHVPGAFKI